MLSETGRFQIITTYRIKIRPLTLRDDSVVSIVEKSSVAEAVYKLSLRSEFETNQRGLHKLPAFIWFIGDIFSPCQV